MAYDKAIAKYRGAVGLELRLRGWTYTQIAEAVGYFDKSGARKAVNRCIEQRASMVFHAFQVHRFLELEDVHRLGWLDALGGKHSAREQVLKAADERVSLVGLV